MRIKTKSKVVACTLGVSLMGALAGPAPGAFAGTTDTTGTTGSTGSTGSTSTTNPSASSFAPTEQSAITIPPDMLGRDGYVTERLRDPSSPLAWASADTIRSAVIGKQTPIDVTDFFRELKPRLESNQKTLSTDQFPQHGLLENVYRIWTTPDRLGLDSWLVSPDGLTRTWLGKDFCQQELFLETDVLLQVVPNWTPIAEAQQVYPTSCAALVEEVLLGTTADISTRTADIATTSDADSILQATGPDGTRIDVPKDKPTTATITTPGGATIGVTVSGGTSTGQRVGEDAVVQADNGPAAQVLNILGNTENNLSGAQYAVSLQPGAASTYRYSMSLPTGHSMQVNDQGGVDVLDAQGSAVLSTPAPYLRDGNGEIPGGATFTVLPGNVLRLDLALDQVKDWPAVADPAWVPVAIAVAINVVRTVLAVCGVKNSLTAAYRLIIDRRPTKEVLTRYATDCLYRQLPWYVRPLIRWVW